MACLVVAAVFAGVVGTVGYFGYDFYMTTSARPRTSRARAPATVQVDIPDGSYGSDMGLNLKAKASIKSADAFTEAAGENKKANSLQGGAYSLRKQMSAAAPSS